MTKPYLGKVSSNEQKQINKFMKNPIKREKQDKGPKTARYMPIRGQDL